MNSLKALIIEDEALIAKALQDKIEQVADDITVTDILPSLKTAKKWFFSNAEPDMIFMDIQLSDGVSFELFEHFKISCPVIFTTAYDEYALRAFKVNGADYLLKPVSNNELEKAIGKCRDIIERKKFAPADMQQLIENIREGNRAPLYKEKFIVNIRNAWMPVNAADTALFMRDNLNYLCLFTGEKYMLDFSTLDEIEELLDPNKFYRANRQFIIHIDAIQSVKPSENARLNVTLKAPLNYSIEISREKAPSFRKWVDR